jgi:acetoin utilization deacetylase AcuC-like enzyme
MQALRRQINRLRALLRAPHVDVVYGRAYRAEWFGMPFDEQRGERILTALAFEGLLRPAQIHEPAAASYQALRRVHSDEYLEALGGAERIERIFGAPLDEQARERVTALQRAMVGGTMLATRLALQHQAVKQARPVINVGGGLHHAGRGGGGGFCMFNDVAVAIAQARADGFLGRALVIDLDLHDGDGTREIFRDDEGVHTLSIHNTHLRDPRGARAATAVALGTNVEDAAYLRAIDEHVPRLLRAHDPALIFYVAGTDPAFDDSMGDWRISEEGIFARDRRVLEACAALAPSAAVVMTLAGGYGPRTWRYTARTLAWLASGRDRFVAPSNDELTLRRYRKLARRLDPALLTGDDDPGLIREEDIYPGFAAPSRLFLGYYSAAGLELALERYGLFDRLRDRGFTDLSFSAVTEDPARQRLRIANNPASGGGPEVLVELQVHRDRGAVVDAEMLAVDWLLLQDPRRPFSAAAPRLPGQKHPGLGLLMEVVGLLVIACERLGLDGLVVVPSHYHLAVQWRKRLRFVDPAAEGRFIALQAALAGMTLAAAAAALSGGRVWDEALAEPVRYVPSPLMLPLSARLLERLASEQAGDQARRAATLAGLRYRLLPGTGAST